MGLYRSATRPSVRCNPVSCRGYFHARRESQYHRKQSWQAGHERTHSCNTLVGDLTPNPIKEPPTAVFFIASNGASARPAGRCEHTFFQPVKSPCIQRPQGRVAAPPVERLARQRKRPLPGDWGRPPTSGFSEKIASAYALALLATIVLAETSFSSR